MKILVTGAFGQLGSELRELSINYPNDNFTFVDREEMPLDDVNKVLDVLEEVQPDVIVSGGAYTAVDKAEAEPELVDVINHQAVAVMAKWARSNDRKLIHISTDYVFQGNSSTPLKEDEPTDPINVYGLSKQKGEEAIAQSGADAVIIRTAWVYSSHGANFVKTMIRLMTERDEISVIADQIGSPTYARDLAKAILDIIQSDKWKKGIYHFSNEGEISWYDFAVAIRELKGLDCKINAIPTEQYPTPAKRPKYSLLDKTKIRTQFGVVVPNWKDSLEEMLIKV
ncbi:dTDP-4-dehydrorhamnose reductase [Sphingobacterium alkalisoli]|uniref:dTDP-4-dehydrorhamnose reductase n=1 Tax=Sphingobacterium alkalisoli TaxID=1874115 RepID=A0A4U0GMZ5_9SPHI|nr:dTDP-4-dehydrorhamnose reductase [Sphingobacterium alkalisoli]TJY60103.1 dTDP-4-dehydrorhamnose reductase [Sphingobacterium alkalisoli]GGH32916.1 NAD(P)-dependent oxidoreductase [Sphingobacterium alkalisoli]